MLQMGTCSRLLVGGEGGVSQTKRPPLGAQGGCLEDQQAVVGPPTRHLRRAGVAVQPQLRQVRFVRVEQPLVS